MSEILTKDVVFKLVAAPFRVRNLRRLKPAATKMLYLVNLEKMGKSITPIAHLIPYDESFIAASTVFFKSMAIVIGPTPPGTGVIA